MNYLIRRAIHNDIEEIIKLCKEHAEYEKAEYNEEGKAEKLAEHLFSDNPKVFCLIAEIKEQIVGYATFMYEFSTWDADLYAYGLPFLRPLPEDWALEKN
jgi:L-amino acid N-acyltransferase YncA